MKIENKYELLKIVIAINCFLAVNSAGGSEPEWLKLKEKVKKELAAKHNFICK